MSPVTKHIIVQLSIIIFVMLLSVALFIAGVYFGFVVLGKGSSSEAFDIETWNHLLEFTK